MFCVFSVILPAKCETYSYAIVYFNIPRHKQRYKKNTLVIQSVWVLYHLTLHTPKTKVRFFFRPIFFSIDFLELFWLFSLRTLATKGIPSKKLGKLSRSFVCPTKVDLPFNISKNKISPQQKESKEC